MLNVFISSTYDDLGVFRDEARKYVRAFGLNDIAAECWGGSPSPPAVEVEKAVRASDLYVGILAWRYGSQVHGRPESFTEFEYDLAKEANLKRLVFFADPGGTWAVNQIDVNREKVVGFRRRIDEEGGITRCCFGDVDDFRLRFVRSLNGVLPALPRYWELSPKHRALLQIGGLISQDLSARETAIRSGKETADRQWFIREIGRCNLGSNYVSRRRCANELAGWLLRRESPFLLLIGGSGIGKTNFLIDQTRYLVSGADPLGTARSERHDRRDVLFLPLGSAKPSESLEENLANYISSHSPSSVSISATDLADLVRNGEVILILDGLDEYARIHGDGKCRQFLRQLSSEIDHERSAVIISCRDHIYKRLRGNDILESAPKVIALPPLDARMLRDAVAGRLGANHPACHAITRDPLRKFAGTPLLLEMMCQMPFASWKRLAREPRLGRLYDLWFEEIVASGGTPEEALQQAGADEISHQVGQIAGLMLKDRSDVIAEDKLQDEGLPVENLRALTRGRFGIFVMQAEKEWGFLHDSFREYSLAKTYATELASRDYRLLADTSSFDYVGAETYRFLYELLSPNERLLEHVDAALGSSKKNPDRWNNIARNCFEALGMVVGQKEAEPMVVGIRSQTHFVRKALEILEPNRHAPSGTPAHGTATLKTMYNIVRCLERLHPSSPHRYFDHVLRQEWPRKPAPQCFGAPAVRGFHQAQPTVGSFPPMVLQWQKNTNEIPRQETLPVPDGNIIDTRRDVSECLLRLLDIDSGLSPDAPNLQVNCSHALIRWLHKDHIDRLKTALGRGGLSGKSKGNLFHALLQFDDPTLFQNCSALFRGMELCWVYVTSEMVSPDFHFEHVTFRRWNDSTLDFPATAFCDCRYL